MPGLVVTVTLLGLVVNEWIGPAVIALALALWPFLLGPQLGRILRDIARIGPLVWLVPLLSLASVAWSPVPDITLRAATELLLTVALALLSVRMVRPDDMVLHIWAVFAAVVCLSIPINHPVFDGDTGRITAAGVFLNKNTLASASGCLVLASLAIAGSAHRPGWLRVTAGVLVVVGVAMAVRARSIADLVALAVAGAVLAGLLLAAGLPRRYRRAGATVFLAMSSAAGAVGGALAWAFSDSLLQLVDKDPTLTGRTLLWFYAARFHASQPWLGRGFAGFWYQGQPQAEFLWALEHIASRSGFSFHSLLWQLLVDLGYLGLACGVAFIAATGFGCIRWVRAGLTPASAFYLAFVLFGCIIQLQGLDLFQVFTPVYFIFLAAFGYGATWRRWRPATAPAAMATAPVSGAP